MDELLYLIAIVAGIGGTFALWRYSRSKKRMLSRMIQKQVQEKNRK